MFFMLFDCSTRWAGGMWSSRNYLAGNTLIDSQVDALVSAMAAFVPPTAGQATLPADYQVVISPVIAASWS